jgi:hypothetical protein
MTFFVVMVMVIASTAAVAWPLFNYRRKRTPVVDQEVSELLARKDAALLAISELESDFEMGNLSESDYRELRTKYDEQAMALLKAVDKIRGERAFETASRLDEQIEAQVSRLRGVHHGSWERGREVCPSCSASLPSGALFCPRCGAALEDRCPECSAAVGADDGFCFRCGAALRTPINR